MNQANYSTIIGIDFSAAYTQISYLDEENRTVQSMRVPGGGEETYLIPSRILKYKGKTLWCIGEEAMRQSERRTGTLIDLPSVLKAEQGITVEGMHYTGSELLFIFLRELQQLVQTTLQISRITHVAVSVDVPDKMLVDRMTEALTQLGISRDHIRVVSHTESFLYYVLHQKREIWNNQVVMMNFGREGFICRIMKLASRRSQNNCVLTEEYDFSQDLNIRMLNSPEGMEQADQIFLSLLKQLFQGRIVSAVYLTGEGFDKAWAKESIPFLCNKRRVFQGNNLIVKGAGFCAREYFYAATLEHYLFQCPGLTGVNISLKTSLPNVESEAVLLKAGVRWYETEAYVEGILDRVSHLTFQVTSPVTGIGKVVYLELKEFPRRPHKTTRVGVHVFYTDAEHFVIEAVDLGFGEFFPASGLKVRETIALPQDVERRLL